MHDTRFIFVEGIMGSDKTVAEISLHNLLSQSSPFVQMERGNVSSQYQIISANTLLALSRFPMIDPLDINLNL